MKLISRKKVGVKLFFFQLRLLLCEAEKAQLNLSQQLLTHNLEKWERKDFVDYTRLKMENNAINCSMFILIKLSILFERQSKFEKKFPQISLFFLQI